jgi:hypothetical protein
MWISKVEYLRILTERDIAVGIARALEPRVIAMEAAADWMRVRVTQIDHERGALIQKYLGVSVPAIRFEEEDRSRTPVSHIINDAGQLFSDVGDQEAARMGIGWDEDGNFLSTKAVPTIVEGVG